MITTLPASIEGTWFVDGLPFGEDGILTITPEGRAVQFPTSKTFPQKLQTMRLWMSPEGEGCVRFRPRPQADGWLRWIEPAESGWTMLAMEGTAVHRFRCRPAAPNSLPEWFDEELRRNLVQMREVEEQKRIDQDDVAIGATC